ncbi:uncharacterized protein LOC118267885 [Spodoptera frugiperda]|uniref:Uncharacterized protein LOC118267885 n=1 Tax=Spodoptera frugiperda TaxID=7108 RepID=A0A9R0EV40_SPOFR|nr:uncharacterized protein LOC118267885 [Spodoptera frugiperda]
MVILRILILIFISRASSLEFSLTKTANNYGPYIVKFYNYKMCSGPRSRNVTISTSTLDIGEFGAIASYNCTFTEPAKVEEFKTIVWNVNGNQKNILWNYKVNKPCQHFVISGIMKQYFPTMRNCVVPPGEYIYKSNYTDISYKFFGSSFFYGDYSFKMNAMAKQGNIMCLQINAVFTKKSIT